jgi:hypothetical protein
MVAMQRPRPSGWVGDVADDGTWQFDRAVARVEATVEAVLADLATSHVGRPVRRRDIRPPRPLPGIEWSIDGDLVVQFVHRAAGKDELLVHDVSLLADLRKRLRSGHIEIRHVSTVWDLA